MSKYEKPFLTFSLDKDHVYCMHGGSWGYAYQTNGTATFYAIDDPHKKATYDFGTLNRLNACGEIEVRPYAQLPEHLYVDNGGAFKSLLFTNACTDLGSAKVQTIAGQPSMRGKIERVFGTLATTLLPRLSGRTF